MSNLHPEAKKFIDATFGNIYPQLIARQQQLREFYRGKNKPDFDLNNPLACTSCSLAVGGSIEELEVKNLKFKQAAGTMKIRREGNLIDLGGHAYFIHESLPLIVDYVAGQFAMHLGYPSYNAFVRRFPDFFYKGVLVGTKTTLSNIGLIYPSHDKSFKEMYMSRT